MITRAVIPAAGAGTRLLPATKALPKAMLPILDVPAIQYVVQEAVDAGIQKVLIVAGRDAQTIEDHFNFNVELEQDLEQRGHGAALESLRSLTRLAEIQFVCQPTPAGLGDAIRCARAFTGDEPFAVLLGDTVMDASIPVTRQLMEAYEKHAVPICAVEEISADKVGRYGIVEGVPLGDGLVPVERLIEKPQPGETASTMAIAGRYILTPGVFTSLENTRAGRNNEIQITDALAKMLADTSIIAVPIDGRRYDIGDKLDYLRTILAFALTREEYAEVVRSCVSALSEPENIQ